MRGEIIHVNNSATGFFIQQAGFLVEFLKKGTTGKEIISSQCLEVWPVSRKQAKTLYQHDRGRGEGNAWLESLNQRLP